MIVQSNVSIFSILLMALIVALVVLAIVGLGMMILRGRARAAVVIVLGAGLFIAFMMIWGMQDRESRRYPRTRYYRGPQPETTDVTTANPTIDQLEAEAMLRVIQSVPETALPVAPPPAEPAANPPATQPSSSRKLWVEDWAGYLNSSRRRTAMIRAESAKPAADPTEAYQLAVANAADQLSRLAYARRDLPDVDLKIPSVAAALIRSGGVIEDQFVQREDRPDGTVWKHHLLVNASPQTLDLLVATAHSRQQNSDRLVILSDATEPASTPPAVEPSTERKLWVDDWVAYQNQKRSGQVLIKAATNTPAVDATEAYELAVASATDKLVPMVGRYLPGADLSIIQRETRAAIESGNLVRDQFVERSDRSYGSIWKHHLLLDVSPQALGPVVHRLSVSGAQKRGRELGSVLTIGILSAVILLTYLYLNVATKGYYVWRLRATAVLAVIAAVLTLTAMV